MITQTRRTRSIPIRDLWESEGYDENTLAEELSKRCGRKITGEYLYLLAYRGTVKSEYVRLLSDILKSPIAEVEAMLSPVK